MPARARIGRLAQEAPNGPESLIEVVLAADIGAHALLAEAETAHDPHRIAEIQTRLADIGAHAAPARAAAILAGLGFDAAAQQRPCTDFSGGWRMRVALAAVLFSEPDLLLLDEPTNYLDLEGTLWLTDHLARYPRTVIVISHDRDLLDDAVDWITARRWRQAHALSRRLHVVRAPARRAAGARRQAREEAGGRAQASAGLHRPLQGQGHQGASGAVARQALAKLEPIAAVANDEVRPIEFPPPAKPLSPPIIALEQGLGRLRAGQAGAAPPDAAHRYGRPHRAARAERQRQVDARQAARRAARARPTARSRGQTASRSRISRSISSTNWSRQQSVYDHVRRLMPDAPEAKVRARAGSIGFSGERADTPVANLSGGEKARLLLGLATFAGPHLLILDEPTNHLDIDSRAALVEAINEYPGAAILVSHDRHLIEACADRLWLVGDGTVAPYEGDLDDYRRLVLGREARARRDAATHEPKVSRTDQRRAAAEKREELKPLKRRIDAAEKTVAKLTADIARDRRAACGRSVRARSRQGDCAVEGARRGRRCAGAGRGGLARRERRLRRGDGLAPRRRSARQRDRAAGRPRASARREASRV